MALLLSAGAQAAEIWLCGLAPSTFAQMHNGEPSDYMALFRPDAPWARAASVVRVFKIYSQFVDRASDDELRTLLADLVRRHIALALEAGLMTPGETCGRGIEGYGGPGAATRYAERLHRFGANLLYIAIDEPLWWGHAYGGANACRTPIDQLARQVADNAAIYKRAFPDVQVGDIETFGDANPPGWVDVIMQWTTAYRQAAGAPFAFFDIDTNWAGPWQGQMPVLAERLHAAGIKFGIIYDGDGSDQTGLAWTRHAEERFVAVEAGLRLVPDQAILQTWMPQPDRMLPETEPGTLTWLVDRYVAAPTQLTLQRVGTRLEGRLTDAAGRPLAGVPVSLAAQTFGTPGALAVHVHAGTVPATATAATLALRVNTECGCAGPADIQIGAMRYRDDRTGETVQQTFQPGVALVRVQAQPGQAVARGTPRFPVTPDDPFTVSVPMLTDPASSGSGYVAVIFLDEHGKEVGRQRLAFGPTDQPVGKLTTDAQGRFSAIPDPAMLQQAAGFRADFAGAPQLRNADATAR